MYNNPFMYTSQSFIKPGILGTLKNINWGVFLGNAGKTLGVINQMVPIVYQIKPIITNAKTVFKIANGLKSSNTLSENINNNVSSSNYKNNNKTSYSPIFYL